MINLQELLKWGADIVVWFQQFSPELDSFFILLSWTGTELFMLLVLPLVIWGFSPKVGVRLLILVLLNTYINAVAKSLFNQPRPYDFDPRVKAIEHASGGGLPSGHTQNAVVFWGYLAQAFKRQWLWVLAFTLMVLVPVSRVYLGAHFPTDLLGGFLIGFVVLILFIKLENKVIHWLESKNISLKLLMAVTFPLGLMFLSPVADSTIIGLCAVLMGGLVGITIEQKWINYQMPNEIKKRAISFSFGLLLLFVFYVGLKVAFYNLEPAPVFRFIRYWIVGFHLTFIAPFLFSKFF